MRRRTGACVLLGLGCAALIGGTYPTLATQAKARVVPSRVAIESVLVDPQHPSTVYVSGSFGLMRSLDAGSTWADLGHGLGLDEGFPGYQRSNEADHAPTTDDLTVDGFVLGQGGVLLARAAHRGPTPDSYREQILRSADGGLSWTSEVESPQTVVSAVAISPVDPRRGYTLTVGSGGGAAEWDVSTSRDAGLTWHGGGNLSDIAGPEQSIGSLLLDPAHADTVYVQGSATWARSDDAGATWTQVLTPTATPALRSFSISTDAHLPGMLVAWSADPAIPADRRFVSGDGGRSWHTARCPGALGHACPSFAVDNVFGTGIAYAFYAAGIYRFRGAGPAEDGPIAGLALPLPLARVRVVTGGSKMSDPLYVLSKPARAGAGGDLYSSIDSGAHWRLATTRLLPNAVPVGTEPGALPVRAARHNVAAPFVSLYRGLGVGIVGLPVTEAYLQGGVLTQDFEHLRLQQRQGRVIVAPLGVDVYYYGSTPGQPDPPEQYVTYSPTMAPPTHKAPAGTFAQFWRAHGGASVLGLPITEEFSSTNGDGSGRSYPMQYFTNARLELHLENKDPHYRILLGLLGPESLRARGWTTGG